jgi:predicted DNA-binding transcriptional regulator AlpA
MSIAIKERMETQALAAAPINRSWPKRYLNPHQAADYLGIGHSTLSIHRMNGTGPKFIKWGVNVRYDILELDLWMTEHAVTPARVTEKRRVGRPRKEVQK